MCAYDLGVLGHAPVVLRREVLIVALEPAAIPVLTLAPVGGRVVVMIAMASHHGVRVDRIVGVDVSSRFRARRMLAARTRRIGRPIDSSFVVVAHASIEVLCTRAIIDVEVPDLAGARWVQTGRPYGNDNVQGEAQCHCAVLCNCAEQDGHRQGAGAHM